MSQVGAPLQFVRLVGGELVSSGYHRYLQHAQASKICGVFPNPDALRFSAVPTSSSLVP